MTIIRAIQWSKKHPEATQVIGSSICPGALNSESSGDQSLILKFLSRFFDSQRFGAYTELHAAFSPEIKNSTQSIAYDKPGMVRKDIANDHASQKKVWRYLE